MATHCYLCAIVTDDFKLVVPAAGADSVPVCRDAPACLNRFLSTIPDAVIAAATGTTTTTTTD